MNAYKEPEIAKPPQTPQRRHFIRALGIAMLAPLLKETGLCADTATPRIQWQSELFRDHPLAGRIWDVNAARVVADSVLIDHLRRASFALLGEVHDNPDHHALQAKLLEALAIDGIKRSVVFEQFDREYETALEQRLASGRVSPDDIAEAVHFDRKGWNWSFYRPLVEIALRNGMPLRVGNLSRKAAASIAKQGLAILEPQRLTALQLDKTWNAERERMLRAIIAEGHCGALPVSAIPNMAAAQRVRDATLAESLIESGEGAVLIAGNGHVRRDLAVPLYLTATTPRRTICALGLLEVDEEKHDPLAYLHSAASQYDFVWFTARTDRPDPCAIFR